MAGQSLERDAKARIGEFYLQKIVEKFNIREWEPDKLEQNPAKIKSIQKTLEAESDIHIPQKIVDLMDLKGMEWREIQPGSFTTLFLGSYNLDEDRDIIPFVENAHASIEIAKQSTPLEKEGNRSCDERKPILLRIGAVTKIGHEDGNKDIDRIIGLTYDLDTKSLIKLNVSLSNNECMYNERLGYVGKDWAPYETADKMTILIPTRFTFPNPFDKKPYTGAALLTQGMNELAELRNRAWQCTHPRALVCQIIPFEITLGKPTGLKDFEDLKKFGEKLGYYAKREGVMIKVGCKKTVNMSNPWELSFPEKLQAG